MLYYRLLPKGQEELVVFLSRSVREVRQPQQELVTKMKSSRWILWFCYFLFKAVSGKPQVNLGKETLNDNASLLLEFSKGHSFCKSVCTIFSLCYPELTSAVRL